MDAKYLKSLKRLADTCRKAGILHFKNEQFEFTLTEEAPVSAYKQAKSAQQGSPSTPSNFESDSLSEEELLFWSSGTPAEPFSEGQPQ